LGPRAVRHSAVERLFRGLDPQALATEFNGDVARLNGPRRALMDRMTLVVLDDAKVTMIGEIPMRTVATMRLPDRDLFLASKRPPYTEMTVSRPCRWAGYTPSGTPDQTAFVSAY